MFFDRMRRARVLLPVLRSHMDAQRIARVESFPTVTTLGLLENPWPRRRARSFAVMTQMLSQRARVLVELLAVAASNLGHRVALRAGTGLRHFLLRRISGACEHGVSPSVVCAPLWPRHLRDARTTRASTLPKENDLGIRITGLFRRGPRVDLRRRNITAVVLG